MNHSTRTASDRPRAFASPDGIAQRLALIVLSMCEIGLVAWLGALSAALTNPEPALGRLSGSLGFFVSLLVLPMIFAAVHVHERGLPESRAGSVLAVCAWIGVSFAGLVVGIASAFVLHMLAAAVLTFALPLYLLDRARLYRTPRLPMPDL